MKKILSIVFIISIILTIFIGCSNSNNVGNATQSSDVQTTGNTTSKTSSKLKGEYVFFVKDGKTFFYDCDKKQTNLLDDTTHIHDIYIDSKRNNLILNYDDGSSSSDYSYLKIKSLSDLDKPMLSFDHSKIVNNKYIIYEEYGSGLFIYDLDTKNKERIIARESNFEYIVKDNKVIFFCDNDPNYLDKNDVYEIGYYDLNTKKIEVHHFDKQNYYHISDVALNYPIVYFVDMSASYTRGGSGVSKLYYYDFNSKQTSLIDEMERQPVAERGKYTLYSGIGLFEENVGTALNDEGVFYSKTQGYDVYDPVNTYYYTKLDDKLEINNDVNSSVGTIDTTDKKLSKFSKYPVMNKSVGGVSSVSGFYIRDKFFEDARIIYVSNEGDYLICRETNGNCYKMNIDTYEKEDLNDDFDSYSIKYFDNHNLLYVSKNKDLKFNGNIIDYNVDSNYIDYNNSFNTFCYEASDGLTIYKDGVSALIENDVDNGCLTNQGNVYYILNNELILYKNNEKQVIDSTENNYDIKVIKYKIIN